MPLIALPAVSGLLAAKKVGMSGQQTVAIFILGAVGVGFVLYVIAILARRDPGAPVGSEVELRVDLPTVAGHLRPVRVGYTVWSCQPAGASGWRLGGSLSPRSAADAEALIEHCAVVSSRRRLTEAGRLFGDAEPRPVPVPELLPRLTAHG